MDPQSSSKSSLEVSTQRLYRGQPGELMARMNSCLLVVALVCAAAASCAATPDFGDQLGRRGMRVHVASVKDEETTTIKIRNRLPVEDKDTVAISCTGELEGQSLGDLDLEEVSPYATVWTPDIYGPADLWFCHFEWVGHNLVIERTDVWKNQGSVTWKIDASGLEYLDAGNDSYKFIKGWEKKSSGTVSSA